MRKLFLALTASILSITTGAQAFWPEATASMLEVGIGYRQDSLKFKTKAELDDYSSSYSDNVILGENVVGLKTKSDWKDLSIFQIEAKGKYVTCDNVYLRLSGDYGWVSGGHNHQKESIAILEPVIGGSPVRGDYINLDTTKSKARGYVYDVNFGVGYQFQLCDNALSLAPVVGYSWHGQHLKGRHQKDSNSSFYISQVVVADPLPQGADLEADRQTYSSSSYSDSYNYYSDSGYSYGAENHLHTRWNGPYLGFDFDYTFGCGCNLDYTLFGTYEFHWAKYHAKGHHASLVQFNDRHFNQHAKNAYGSIFDIGIKWDLCDCWTVALKGEFQWWWADKGRQKHEFIDASFGDVRVKCSTSRHLSDVKWDSAAVSVNVGMVF